MYIHANPRGFPYRIYEITDSSWEEDTVTWYNRPSTTPEHLPMDTVTADHLTDPNYNVYREFDVTENFLDIVSDYGWMIMMEGGASTFASDDYATANMRPELIVTFTENAIQEPATMILLLVYVLGLFKKIRK